jgi:hypothetical protein
VRTQNVAVAVAALGGVIAGMLIGPSLFAAKRNDSRGVEVVPALAAGNEDQQDQDRRRLAALEAQLGRMEARNVMREAASQPTATTAGAGADHKPPDISPEAVRERLRSLSADRRARHQNEPVDPAWARVAEPGLQADLVQLAKSDAGAAFVVQGVECKTRSCAAELRFPSYGSADGTASRLLHEPYSQSCARTVFVPEPDDPGAPYTVTLYFQCNDRT